MSSSKSTTPRAPQRKRGELRVAALLEAAIAVFAEKGFEAATMTEIAARAGAPIGSLYQFFPNKDVLGDALIDRYTAQLDVALANIEARAAGLTTADLADALLDLFPSHRQERDAALALIDARPDRNHRGVALRDELRRRLAALFAIRAPHRTDPELAGVTVAFLSSMKAIATVSAEEGRPEAALTEVRTMARLYLAERLGA